MLVTKLARFFGKSPAATDIPAADRKLFEEALVFDHRTDVERVIFMSTPHRGSDLAAIWLGRFASNPVKLPLTIATLPVTVVSAAANTDPTAVHLKQMPNSIDTLSPKNRFVQAANKLPITPSIPYHSIVGDRGQGIRPRVATAWWPIGVRM